MQHNFKDYYVLTNKSFVTQLYQVSFKTTHTEI